jgi:hypothetical protein
MFRNRGCLGVGRSAESSWRANLDFEAERGGMGVGRLGGGRESDQSTD